MLIKICELTLNGKALLVNGQEEWVCVNSPETKRELERKMQQLVTLYGVFASRVHTFYHNEPLNDWLLQHLSTHTGYRCALERQFNGAIRAVFTPLLDIQDFWREFREAKARGEVPTDDNNNTEQVVER